MKFLRIILTLLALAVAVVVVAALAIVLSTGGASHAPANSGYAPRAAGPSTVTVEDATVGPPIPTGFVGLSTEYSGLEPYAGTNPNALDPVFEQLIRNLAPGQSPILRFGGSSTDWTWYPLPHLARPGGVRIAITPAWLRVASALVKATNARLLLGINFEADSGRVAAGEAQALIAGLGQQSIDAFELGNEPELYGSFSWYKLPDGQHVRGRPSSYDYATFIPDFANVARSMPREVTLAGPDTGAPKWIPLLGQFMSANPRVRLVTVHKYPLKHCSPTAVITIPEILSDTSSIGLAASVAGAVAAAHSHGVALRVDEMSAISCGGVKNLSDSFSTALWAVNALFAMARAGVQGVNIQTAPGSWNELFGVTQTGSTWEASVHPLYYGLMMFAQAAPAGSRLLRLVGATASGVNAWATRATDGNVRVVLVNTSTSGSRLVTVRDPAAGATTPATLERLTAPSAAAHTGVTLDGLSFGTQTRTGVLAGTPALTPVKPVGGGYAVTLPAASAAMLTVPAK